MTNCDIIIEYLNEVLGMTPEAIKQKGKQKQ